MAEENTDVVYKQEPTQQVVEVTNSELPKTGEVTEQHDNDGKAGEEVVNQQEEQQDETTEVESSLQEAVINQIADLGFDVEAVDAWLDKYGEIPKELYDAFVEANGKLVADLIKERIESAQKNWVESRQKQDKAMFSQLEKAFEGITDQSGEQTWQELKGWAKTNLAEKKDELNQMLKSGGLQAEMALNYIVEQFKASEDFGQPAQLLDGDDFANDYNVTPLSKHAYNEQLNALMNKGYDYNSIEVKRLQAQRLKAIKRGQ